MKTVELSFPKTCRIICVSDIHANREAFDRLLGGCGYEPGEDYLLLLGDILEKGSENLQTLRRVMELLENPRVFLIKGNNDTMCEGMAWYYAREDFFYWLERRPVNTYSEMAGKIGISDFETDFEEKRAAVNGAFAKELEFIRELPHAIDTEDFLFVHAGLENRPDYRNSGEWSVMKNDWFLRKEHCLDKFVVAGHMPCYCYGRSGNTNLPIIDRAKKIIDIDGGASVKRFGQINAFIMQKNGGEYDFATEFMPIAPKASVLRDYRTDARVKYCDYEKSDLEILEEDGVFYRVLNRADGETGLIPRRYTESWNGRLHGWLNLDSFVSVKRGESFYPAAEVGKYLLGTAENGQVGLVPGECIG